MAAGSAKRTGLSGLSGLSELLTQSYQGYKWVILITPHQ